MTILDRLDATLADLEPVLAGAGFGPDVTDLRARLRAPLRVAVAGRVKAGKSTLLNALVGELLAATDAGECTQVVTVYRDGLGYEVTARLRDGRAVSPPFRRDAGQLEVDLDGIDLDAIEHLEVTWPSSTLRDTTLIDTPGLGSAHAAISQRTELALDHVRGPGDADAVIYLMRHLHERDAHFLDSFLDRSVPAASPVNAIAVLSRADEIGGGRLDALDGAARIAARYCGLPALRRLVVDVVPVAGLLAEFGRTVREHEIATLRELAADDRDDVDDALVSADRFREPSSTTVAAELRANLLERAGLFGVRFVVDLLRREPGATASQVADALVAASGVDVLRRQLRACFGEQADVLRARSALAALTRLAAEARAADPSTAGRVAAEVERFEATAPELAELRARYLVATGVVAFDDRAAAEVVRACGPGSAAARCGLAEGTPADVVRDATLAAIERWRTKAGDPRADPLTVEACELVAATYERLFAGLAVA